jgi:DNA-binding NarL/FixJ family response regulator
VVGVIHVLIADDDPLVRAGLTMLLRGAGDVRIVGEATDGEEALARAASLAPDVVLMDIRMPRMDGLAATERLRARDEAPEVVVLTTYDVDEYVLRALRAGASGFLLKDSPPEDIVRAIRLVASGEAMLSPTVTRQLLRHFAGTEADARRSRAREALHRLTGRERQVAVALPLAPPRVRTEP